MISMSDGVKKGWRRLLAGAAAPARSRCHLTWLALAGLGFCALVGCASDQRLGNDPLLGGPPRPIQPAPAVPRASLPQPPLPPAPPPGTAASNAALAAGTPRTLDPARELRIGGGDPQGNYSQEGSIGAVLNRPQPVGETVARNAPPPAFGPGPAVSGPRVASYDQAQALLAARGVAWQRLETGDRGDWKFICSVPNRQNPSISRTYEAHGSDYLGTIQAVLDQMSQESGGRD